MELSDTVGHILAKWNYQTHWDISSLDGTIRHTGTYPCLMELSDTLGHFLTRLVELSDTLGLIIKK